MLSTNMAEALTTSEKAEKFEEQKAKAAIAKKERKQLMHVWGLRAAQLGTSLLVSGTSQIVGRAVPASKTFAYGLLQPDAVAVYLGVTGTALSSDKTELLREASVGMLTSGSNYFARVGADKLYDLIIGA